ALDGEWQFYWQKFYFPDDFANEVPPKHDMLIPVPGTWEKQSLLGKKLPAKGYATYRLHVKLKDTRPIGFYTKGFGTSMRLYINGKLVIQSGKPSRQESQAKPRSVPVSFTYFPKQQELDLVLHISNYHYRMAGAWYSLEIADPQVLLRQQQYWLFLQIFVFSCMFIMGLYHIGLFVNRRTAREALYFGLFCLVFSLRNLVLGEKLLPSYFTGMPWEAMMKTEYLSFYASAPLFLMYFYHLYPQIVYRKFLYFVHGVAAVFISLVVSNGSYFYTNTVVWYQLFVLVCSLYLLLMLGWGLYKKIQGVKLFTASLLVFITTVVHDILFSHQIIMNTIHLAPFGFIAFIFLQSYLLSKNFSRAFSVSEELALQLQEKNSALTKLDKLKDDFLANTSHELKTPLNGIIGLSESLLDGAAGKLPKKVAYNLSLIITSSKRLSNLVNDILDFSKMKSNEVQVAKQPVDLYSITNLVLTLSHNLLQDKKIDLRNSISDDFPAALGDENRIQQILYNLIGNGIKFTDVGLVEVKAELQGEVIHISISDTGIGIPEEKYQAIFRSFEQVDSASDRSFGGTGLGLTVTKQLVELHGGEISLVSQVGKGSTFTFTLPVSHEKAKSVDVEEEVVASVIDKGDDANSEAEIPIGSSNYTIMIVDDEPINLQVLNNHLSLQKYSVLQANGGQEALNLLQDGDLPDLILLDVMMPKMTGYEVCRKIREKYNANVLPIVLLTAKNQVNDLVQGFIHGANDYLTKPFSKDELLTRIKNHLSLSKTSGAYEKFVPQEFIRLLNKENIIDIKLGDYSEKIMSVLFCDIRSFTTLSESMNPKDNFNFINSYLKRMSPIIQEYQGFIDKYIGDAIMALFPETADDAVKAGIHMQQKLSEYNEHRKQSGYQIIEIGIGINTGKLMLGTIGGLNRMEGTVISDAVNLASRVESMTKKYACSVLISETTYQSLQDISEYHIRPIDKVIVKGKTKSVWIYEVFDSDAQDLLQAKLATQKVFGEAVHAYVDKEYEKAQKLFQQIASESPQDRATQYFLGELQSMFVES
ncbi:MAG: response regulator, partial [Spirochaetota bacterium]